MLKGFFFFFHIKKEVDLFLGLNYILVKIHMSERNIWSYLEQCENALLQGLTNNNQEYPSMWPYHTAPILRKKVLKTYKRTYLFSFHTLQVFYFYVCKNLRHVEKYTYIILHVQSNDLMVWNIASFLLDPLHCQILGAKGLSRSRYDP